MGIKLSWGIRQMGPARRPQPALFIKKKKKDNPPPPRGFARGGKYGMGVGRWARGSRCFANHRIPVASLVTLAPQVNCLSPPSDLCFVAQIFLKQGVSVQTG